MRTLYSYGSQILVTSLSLPLCGREQCGGILSNEIIDQRKDILDKALSERYRESRELIWAFFYFDVTKDINRPNARLST